MGEDSGTSSCSIFQLIVTTGVNSCMLLSSIILLGVFIRSCKHYGHKEIKRYVLAHTVFFFLYLIRVVWTILSLISATCPYNDALVNTTKFLNHIGCLFFYLSLSYYARNWLYVLLYLKWRRAALLCRILFILVDSILSLFVLIAAIVMLVPVNEDMYPNLLAYSTQIVGYSSLAIVLFYTVTGAVVLCLWRGQVVRGGVVKQFYLIAILFILSSVVRMILFNWHQWFDVYIPCDIFNIVCIMLPDCCVGGALMKAYYVSLTNPHSASSDASQEFFASGFDGVYSVVSVESIKRLDSAIIKNADRDQSSDDYYFQHSLLK